MAYSSIDYIEVINFMVYSHAKISFDDSNIINLKGYNSSGKSAMLKAVVCCMLNMYTNSQTKFIRHGESYFRIMIKFKDGVLILKDRYISGQSLYEVYKNEELIFTTKVGSRFAKVYDVPQVIEDYLGMCIVSTGALNYQVRNDKLWLIETTGSDNYNSLNEILKSEEISRASSLINSDRNKLSSEITGIEASLNEVKLSLIDISEYTEELLDRLEKREKLCKRLSDRYRDISSLVKLVEDIKSIPDIPDVPTLDSDRLGLLSSIGDTVSSLNSIVINPDVSKCDIRRLSDIERVNSALLEYSSVEGLDVPDILEIETNRGTELENMLSLLKEYSDSESIVSACYNDYQDTVIELDRVVNEALKNGIEFVRCDTCGSYIEVLNKGNHSHEYGLQEDNFTNGGDSW